MAKKRDTMTAERILGYLQAVYAALAHKRVPFKATTFRKNYGISPHVHSAMLANGIIYQDTDENGLLFWCWLADEPSMALAGQVLLGYKERIKRYGKNAAVARAEAEAHRKAMERFALIKKGMNNKGRMQEVFDKAKAASDEIKLGGVPRLPWPIGDKMPDDVPVDDTEDPEAKAAVEEVVEVRKERQALVEMDYTALEARIMALMAMSEEKFNALSEDIKQLVAMNRRLLKLHDADGV